MKYVMLFVGTREDQDAWDSQPKAQYQAAMAAAGKWFGDYTKAGKVIGGEQLQGKVTTVRRENGEKVITDGPFIETKEVIGGFARVEAKDLDEAHEIAKAWPGGPVEIWPAVEER